MSRTFERTQAGRDAVERALRARRVTPGEVVTVPVQFCNRSNDRTDGVSTFNSSAPRAPTASVTLVNPLNRVCP